MRSLRVKILVLAALLVVLTQAGTIGTVLFTANREVQRTAGEKLSTAGAVLKRVLQIRADQLQSTMRMLAADREFIAAVMRGDSGALSRAGASADVALVLGAEGQVLSPAAAPQLASASLPGLVRLAAESGDSRAIVNAGNRAYEVTAVPLGRADAGRPRWLAMGVGLDDSRARRIAQLTGLQVAFVTDTDAGLAILGSSVSGVDVAGLARHMARRADDDHGIFNVSIQGSDYLAVHQPLLPTTADVAVVLLESVDDAVGPYRVLRTSALVLGALALIAALSGGALVARAITLPVRQLAGAATRIRNGDYSNAVEVTADNELGMLAAAFNTMQAGIAERENRISYQAQFDGLTGLPNRVLALSRLGQAITQAQVTPAPISVLVVDLGSFGDITASLGHDIGDALLAQAAERLRARVDARHVVARLEGDTFVIILDGLGLDPARELAEDLLRLLGLGLSVQDANISLDAAVGIALYPEHSTEPDQLLLRAMVAQNDARAAQQGIHLYQDGSEERRVRQLAILGDLRRAVRRDELKLHLQPKLSLSEGRVCGAEALVRWDHPSLGWLTPGEFIGVAEQFGNISLITHWALTAAVRECRLWVEEGLDLTVSVNLSSRDLLDQNLPIFIRELLRDHDLAPRHLTLEITEEALVKDFSHATLVLQCLRDLGVRISIDDFGTGYSSLARIRNLPVDELKIDRSFVTNLPQDSNDAAIVRACMNLAHNLGLEVVAEGVETAAALHWLAAHGCETAQGYLISRPMPAEEFGAWVNRFYAERLSQAGVLAVAVTQAG